MTTNDKTALQTVAVAQWLRKTILDAIKDTDEEARTYLKSTLTPGERRIATTEDGQPIGSVTRSEEKTTSAFTVTNDEALADWLEDHGHTVTGHWVLDDHFKADTFLAGVIEAHEGEIPDGVTTRTKTTGGTVTVRLNDTQRANLNALLLGHTAGDIIGLIGGTSDE